MIEISDVVSTLETRKTKRGIWLFWLVSIRCRGVPRSNWPCRSVETETFNHSNWKVGMGYEMWINPSTRCIHLWKSFFWPENGKNGILSSMSSAHSADINPDIGEIVIGNECAYWLLPLIMKRGHNCEYRAEIRLRSAREGVLILIRPAIFWSIPRRTLLRASIQKNNSAWEITTLFKVVALWWKGSPWDDKRRASPQADGSKRGARYATSPAIFHEPLEKDQASFSKQARTAKKLQQRN